MGNIGKIQGVKLVNKPPIKAAKKAKKRFSLAVLAKSNLLEASSSSSGKKTK